MVIEGGVDEIDTDGAEGFLFADDELIEQTDVDELERMFRLEDTGG